MNRTSIRRLARPIALLLALGLAPTASGTAASATAACENRWGSLVKASAPHTGKQVTDVRSGRHRCFDRLVIDLNGDGRGAVGYRVRYVAQVRADGSGAPVPVRGGARLSVVVKAPAYADGQPTYTPQDPGELVDVTGYNTFRQVAWAGSFEGYTTLALGVRARLPMRVTVLPGPGDGRRVVVDVAHRW